MTFDARTFFRYQKIIDLLSVRRYQTVREVRALLEEQGESISERQLKRILDSFHKELGLDVRERRGQKGPPPMEYGWTSPEQIPGVSNDVGLRALTLQLAAELVEPLVPGPALEHLSKELKIAKSTLILDMAPSAQRLPNKLAVLPRGIGRPYKIPMRTETLGTIYEALLKEQRLEVGYSARYKDKAPPKTHELSPLGMICRFDTLYLVHVCEPKSARHDPDHVMEWPVHRFSRAKLLNKPIRKPPGFNLKEHLEYPGIIQNLHKRLRELGREFEIKLVASEGTARYIEERRFSKDQESYPLADGRYEITATVLNTRDLLSELFNFADDVEVIAPNALREYMKERAECTAALYSR